MLEVVLVPLGGLMFTLLILAIYYYLVHNQFRIHNTRIDHNELPPRIFTLQDVNALCNRFKKANEHQQKLVKRGISQVHQINLFKQAALLLDRDIGLVESDSGAFLRARDAVVKLLQEKRAGDVRLKLLIREGKTGYSQKELSCSPRDVYFPGSSNFLPPNLVCRVSMLAHRLRSRSGVNEKTIKKQRVAMKRGNTKSEIEILEEKKEKRMARMSLLKKVRMGLHALTEDLTTECVPSSRGLQSMKLDCDSCISALSVEKEEIQQEDHSLSPFRSNQKADSFSTCSITGSDDNDQYIGFEKDMSMLVDKDELSIVNLAALPSSDPVTKNPTVASSLPPSYESDEKLA